jgi:hypothetical protein
MQPGRVSRSLSRFGNCGERITLHVEFEALKQFSTDSVAFKTERVSKSFSVVERLLLDVRKVVSSIPLCSFMTVQYLFLILNDLAKLQSFLTSFFDKYKVKNVSGIVCCRLTDEQIVELKEQCEHSLAIVREWHNRHLRCPR